MGRKSRLKLTFRRELQILHELQTQEMLEVLAEQGVPLTAREMAVLLGWPRARVDYALKHVRGRIVEAIRFGKDLVGRTHGTRYASAGERSEP